MDPVYNQFCLGCLAIVTREVLMIFAADLSHLKVTFRGSFRGLAESREGDIFTIADTPSGPIIKKIACKGKNSDYYSLQDGGHIRLEVVREFKHWERQARPSFLLWRDQTLVIADPGLHKIYQVNEKMPQYWQPYLRFVPCISTLTNEEYACF